MSENTVSGPAGANKPAVAVTPHQSHNTQAKDGRTGDAAGRGADASSVVLPNVEGTQPVNP